MGLSFGSQARHHHLPPGGATLPYRSTRAWGWGFPQGLTDALGLSRAAGRPDPRGVPRPSDRRGQGLDVVGPLVASAVDEEARRAGAPAGVGACHVLGDAVRVLAPSEIVPEAIHVEAQ